MIWPLIDYALHIIIFLKVRLPKEFLKVGVGKACRGKCFPEVIFLMIAKFVEPCKIYKFGIRKKVEHETIYFNIQQFFGALKCISFRCTEGALKFLRMFSLITKEPSKKYFDYVWVWPQGPRFLKTPLGGVNPHYRTTGRQSISFYQVNL